MIRIDPGSSAAAGGLNLLIVLGGAHPAGPRPAGASAPRHLKAEALDASGRVLGTSAVTPNAEAS